MGRVYFYGRYSVPHNLDADQYPLSFCWQIGYTAALQAALNNEKKRGWSI